MTDAVVVIAIIVLFGLFLQLMGLIFPDDGTESDDSDFDSSEITEEDLVFTRSKKKDELSDDERSRREYEAEKEAERQYLEDAYYDALEGDPEAIEEMEMTYGDGWDSDL